MTRWTFRKPHVKITFYTKKGNITLGTGLDNVKDVVSISTSNTLNQAAGTFQIDLVARPVSGKLTYADILQPMDMVEIEIGSKQTLMMGETDRIVNKESVTGNGVNKRISITGRSLGAIWLFDNIRYFIGIQADQLPKDLGKRLDVLMKGSSEKAFWGLDAIEAVKTIVETFTTIQQAYNKNSDNYTVPTFALYEKIDYISELAVVKDRKIYNPGLKTFQGSIWQYMKSCIIPPFEELWTDSKDGKLFLRMRPAPFMLDGEEWSIGKLGLEIIDPDTGNMTYEAGSIEQRSWDNIPSWISPNYGHTITPQQIIGYNLSKSHGEALSFFHIVPSSYLGLPKDLKNGAFPPLIDPELMQTLGSRGVTFPVNLLPISEVGNITESGQGKSFMDWFVETRNKAYLWYKDNHKYLSGTITIMGNSDIRTGDKIILQSRNGVERTYYCEGVNNVFTWGKPFITALTLTRGATEVERRQWWDHGEYKIENQIITAPRISFNKPKPVLPDKIPTEISNVIDSVLDKMAEAPGYSHVNLESAKKLMAATAAIESAGFQHKVQQTESGEEGTPVSFWQVEPDTAYDNYDNYLKSTNEKRVGLEEKISDATGVSKDIVDLTPFDMRSSLKNNIEFACAMARVKYLRDSEPVPYINDPDIDVAEEMGKYWKRVYNTNAGAGSLKQFVEYWIKWMS